MFLRTQFFVYKDRLWMKYLYLKQKSAQVLMLTNVLSTSITNKNNINNNATHYTDTGRQGKGEVFLALNDYFLCLIIFYNFNCCSAHY
jgi:hypothetical protein